MPNFFRISFKPCSSRLFSTCPSTTTRPLSGNKSPMMCLMSTLLPLPLPPITVMLSPFSTVRFTPRSTSRLPKLLCTSMISIIAMASPQERGQEIVKNEDQHTRDDNRACGRLSHTFRTALGMKSLISADQPDHGAEHQRFDQSVPDVRDLGI